MADITNEFEKGRRVSLTKLQLASRAGADLLALCQSVTSDGSLAEEEITQLKVWLSENRESDLPAVSFLIPIVERILEDGVVTEAEARELFISIERVLPSEIRGLSKSARVAIENEQKTQHRAVEADKKAAAREVKERNRVVGRFDFMVAGTRHEGRAKIIERTVDEGDQVTLQRDVRNSHSRNAVEVLTNRGDQIGFVPEDHAVDLAPLLDVGHKCTASIKKMLTGGRSPIPVVVATFHRADVDFVRSSPKNADIRTPINTDKRTQISTNNSAPMKAEKTVYVYKGIFRIVVGLVFVAVLIRACTM